MDIVESFDSLILYELYVPVKYREKGIGRDVLKELSNLALKIGYSKITVYPKPIDNNYSEQNLVKWYEKSGFKKKENKTGEYEYIIDPRQFVEVDRK